MGSGFQLAVFGIRLCSTAIHYGAAYVLLEMGVTLAVEGSQKAGMTATESMLCVGRRASRLMKIARAIQDYLEQGLYFHARWKEGPDGGEILLIVPDSDLVLSPQDIGVYSQLQEKQQISLQTLWKMM